ncbi:hypothetical protein A1Q2_00671 [Trichosporon asahii var. asahii CBS 8904]|uniref:Integrase catalytic domain-containing protein n=1 Tax=Trichosporon asahii var. asahii (strain CBS 8904) TaxID=1220162 RepID=K1VZN6_TRIAC|nr:hypothetical protein A1Q2_00671 [Trichosporon asahii var. asahii CBS 8904]
MSLDFLERPRLTYLNPATPSAELSDQDLIDYQRLLHLEITPIVSWLESEPEDRDYTLLGDFIGIAEDVLEAWHQLFGAIPRGKFSQVYILLENFYKTLASRQGFLDDQPEPSSVSLGRLPSQPGLQGAPRLDIDLVQLCSLLSIRDLTYEEIGHLAGCSGKTVQRRAKEMGVNRRNFSEITQEELDRAVIAAYLRGSGDQGYRAIHTYLELEGIKVTRDQVQATCRRLNPNGTWDRWIRARLRRVYRVPWINSLWHIDGHHKLNPWKIVIHGGVDGFSRRVVFLRASNNNLAMTVESCFMEATRLHGWPSRVRVDYGGENLGVKKRLEEVRGTVDSKGRWRGTFIQGPSTRNQRIERLWVDLQKTCTSRHRSIFIYLENIGYLSPDNDIDLWALHYVYLPVVNEALKCFVSYWDKHRIRTAGNQSPAKMWAMNEAKAKKLKIRTIQYLEGVHGQEDEGIMDLPDDRTQQYFEDYGVDDYGRRPMAQLPSQDPQVEVPSPDEGLPTVHREFLYDPAFLRALQDSVGPVWPVDDACAMPQYLKCREMVYARLGFQPPMPHWWG